MELIHGGDWAGQEERLGNRSIRDFSANVSPLVLAAFTMGKGIAIVGNVMDKHVTIAPYITAHIKRHGSHNAQYAGR